MPPTVGSIFEFTAPRSTTSPDPNELLVARFLLGTAEGNMWPVSNALTNRWFPAREHSRAQAFWLTGATLGTAIGVPIVTILMQGSGWRGMVAGLAAVSLLPLLIFAFIPNRPREEKTEQTNKLPGADGAEGRSGGQTRLGFGPLLRTPSFWLMTFCMIVSVPTIFTIIQMNP